MFNFFIKKGCVEPINFQNMQHMTKDSNAIIINTMDHSEQECLIINTIDINRETQIINTLIDNYDFKSKKMVIYGKHCNDLAVNIKASQLSEFGFMYIYVYTGGLFEWILLQDIYTSEHFQTTTVVNDILKFKPHKIMV